MKTQVYNNSVPSCSPWGRIDHKEKLAEGIFITATPSHGGVWLSQERQAEINKKSKWLNTSEWWEEDCDWSVPVAFFANAILIYSPDKESMVISARETISMMKDYLEGRR